MDKEPALRQTAKNYWERRRLIYNLCLVPPTLLGYLGFSVISAGVGDRANFGIFGLVLMFAGAALGANICYTFCYALEFWLGADQQESFWFRYGCTITFIAGTILAMLFAIIGGRDIAVIQYSMG
jgi:hypothetical protein